jgi:ElaB/YqjD/DUF883 family membrane-anchored ribosome-binding protein
MGMEEINNPESKSVRSSGYSDSGDGRSREFLDEITRQSKDVTQYIARQIKLQARTVISDQKTRLSRRLETIVYSLRNSGSKLREQDQSSTAEIAEKGAEEVERLSESLRRKDVDELIKDVEEFARQRPAVFAGMALAAGFLLGQVISSSRESLRSSEESQSGHVGEDFPAQGEESYREWH